MTADGAPVARTLLLVGCGKMGGALLAGWLDRLTIEHIHVVEPGPGGQRFAQRGNVALHAGAASLGGDLVPEIVVLAVKPQAMPEVLKAYGRFADGRTAFLSIAAGRTIAYMRRALGATAPVVRAMPNTPAAIGRGISVACAGPGVSARQHALAERLLGAVGEVAWVKDEALLDAVTALSGSGPAYVFLLIECMEEAGVAAGLPRDLARKLARATVSGSGELVRLSPESAAKLREEVTSPGGTTRAALDILMAPDGMERLLRRAVEAATQRSRDLAE